MKSKLLLGATAAVILLGGSVFAKPVKTPKITLEQAQEIAMKRVGGGTIEQSDLVMRHGKARYSVFVKEDSAITAHELISAKNGKIKWVRDETPETAKIK